MIHVHVYHSLCVKHLLTYIHLCTCTTVTERKAVVVILNLAIKDTVVVTTFPIPAICFISVKSW